MVCLTDLVDHAGREYFDADWPDITAAPPKKMGATLLTGRSALSRHFPEEELLDPAWNEMIEAAMQRVRTALYSAPGQIVAIDVNGYERLVPRSVWASYLALNVISQGQYRPDDRPDVLKGWVYAPMSVLSGMEGTFSGDPDVSEDDAVPSNSAPAVTGSKRGPKPLKTEMAKSAMLSDLHEGLETQQSLGEMKEIALAEKYGVGRETARKARAAALSEFENTNSDN